MKSGREPLVINDLTKHELSKDLEVTAAFGGGCLIGVPLLSKNGERFGTLCGMDNKPFEFLTEHVQLFIEMAEILTYIIELDTAVAQVKTLSVPIVTIFSGIAVLPIIGNIDHDRAEMIIEETLIRSHQLSIQHLIIDLSGINYLDLTVTFFLQKLVGALRLVGIMVKLTGISPDLAVKAIQMNINYEEFTTFTTIEMALAAIQKKN